MSKGTDVYSALVAAGDAWADAQFEAQQLEDTEKTFLYQLAHNLVQLKGMSMAAAEKEARASADFHSFVINKCEVRRHANKARVRYDAQKVLADWRRTEAVNERKSKEVL